MISPHPRYSFHSHFDKKGSWINDIPGHRRLVNGYYYWTVRISPTDAAARGIKDGDVVRLYNDRGSVLGAATVTERIKPGVIHSFCSSGKYDPVGAGQGLFAGPGRLRQPAHLRPADVQERAGDGAQFLSCRDRKMGGLT